jgi:hypothetical protein
VLAGSPVPLSGHIEASRGSARPPLVCPTRSSWSSDRLFAALQGLGGHVRYVSLPAEAHGYRARESALHVLWEQVRWLDTYVKNARPRSAPRLTAR